MNAKSCDIFLVKGGKIQEKGRVYCNYSFFCYTLERWEIPDILQVFYKYRRNKDVD